MTLTYVDRFILALWKRNDQLSVYNPGLKTQYDTNSWVKKYGGTEDPVLIKNILSNYKRDLLASLEYDDTFPMSFDEGKELVERFVGKDSRNMSKWLGKQYVELRDRNMTYEKLYSEYVENPEKSLGSRYSPARDTIGFTDATFVEMVEEKFTYKKIHDPEPVFGKSKEDDMSKYRSSYFWFMYGILPRKDITYLEIKEGLFAEDKDENMVKIEKTIKFLGLVFNVRAPSVRFVIKISGGENKESETFKFINTYSEIPYPLDAKVELRPLRIDEENKIGHINIDKPKEAQPGGQVVDGRLRQMNDELKTLREKLQAEQRKPDVNTNKSIQDRITTFKAKIQEKQKEIEARRALVNSQNQGVGTTGQGGSGAPAATPGLSRQERKQAARAAQTSGN